MPAFEVKDAHTPTSTDIKLMLVCLRIVQIEREAWDDVEVIRDGAFRA